MIKLVSNVSLSHIVKIMTLLIMIVCVIIIRQIYNSATIKHYFNVKLLINVKFVNQAKHSVNNAQ